MDETDVAQRIREAIRWVADALEELEALEDDMKHRKERPGPDYIGPCLECRHPRRWHLTLSKASACNSPDCRCYRYATETTAVAS